LVFVFVTENEDFDWFRPVSFSREIAFRCFRIFSFGRKCAYRQSAVNLAECGTCQCPLTVKHILVECVDLDDVRNKHIVVSSIKDVFDNVEAQKIVDYIKETRFYKQQPCRHTYQEPFHRRRNF